MILGLGASALITVATDVAGGDPTSGPLPAIAYFATVIGVLITSATAIVLALINKSKVNRLTETSPDDQGWRQDKDRQILELQGQVHELQSQLAAKVRESATDKATIATRDRQLKSCQEGREYLLEENRRLARAKGDGL